MGASVSLFQTTFKSRRVAFCETDDPCPAGKVTEAGRNPRSFDSQVQGTQENNFSSPRQLLGASYNRVSTETVHLGKRKAVHHRNDFGFIRNERFTPKTRIVAAVRGAERKALERK